MTLSRLAVIAAVGSALILATAGTAGQARPYTRAATLSCLMRLPNSVAGIPPATSPIPPALFVDALAHDTVGTSLGVGRRPRAHTQLGTWYGKHYGGIILSFFRSAADARASFKTLAWLYGGTRIRNVVATWDQKPRPSRAARHTVLGCLRSTSGPVAPARSRPASLATFAGSWGGHTRGLSITQGGRGREETDGGCCTRMYHLEIQIVSVTGTLTRATAIYRVTAFRRFTREVRKLDVGDVGKLVLNDGIVVNRLTGINFCSGPAWGVTGACGA